MNLSLDIVDGIKLMNIADEKKEERLLIIGDNRLKPMSLTGVNCYN